MTSKQWLLLSALLLLQVGDMVSTRFALSHGASELNPLVRAMGLWQSKLAVGVLIALLVIRGRFWAMYAVGAVYVVIVGWNLHLVMK